VLCVNLKLFIVLVLRAYDHFVAQVSHLFQEMLVICSLFDTHCKLFLLEELLAGLELLTFKLGFSGDIVVVLVALFHYTFEVVFQFFLDFQLHVFKASQLFPLFGL
jgi:hypothetical protein